MASKSIAGAQQAPDGSSYVTLTDGAGNLGGSNAADYPSTATPITASATGTTNATAATLAGVAGKTTYIAGFSTNATATAATSGAAVVSGTKTGSLNFLQAVGAGAAVQTLSMSFYPPIPASAVNTGIVVTSVAPGAGGAVAVSAWGYQL